MVDLKTQYRRIKDQVDEAVLECIDSGAFIKGPPLHAFEKEFAEYQGAAHVIGCGNGTDALQLALMGLGLKPGDEVIVPAFTYVATAEVIALLGLTPVLVDVDSETFNITPEIIEAALTEQTKAVVPVHLYGQCADMDPILELCQRHQVAVVEDAAQATGAVYTSSDGAARKAGSIATIGCTSFFPTKNLGCYGDGGALMTNDEALAKKLRMIANHGQGKKYHHAVIGVNSRLDTVQAAILRVKLRQLDDYVARRQAAAHHYDQAFSKVRGLSVPARAKSTTHTFHQYTLKVSGGRRDALREHLAERGVPSVVYYPLPLHHQEAFRAYDLRGRSLVVSEQLCEEVLSLPIHTELESGVLGQISDAVLEFFN